MEGVKEGDYLCFKFGAKIIVDKVVELNGCVCTQEGYELSYHKANVDKISKTEAEVLLQDLEYRCSNPTDFVKSLDCFNGRWRPERDKINYSFS